jgi:hypothetical protein
MLRPLNVKKANKFRLNWVNLSQPLAGQNCSGSKCNIVTNSPFSRKESWILGWTNNRSTLGDCGKNVKGLRCHSSEMQQGQNVAIVTGRWVDVSYESKCHIVFRMNVLV